MQNWRSPEEIKFFHTWLHFQSITFVIFFFFLHDKLEQLYDN